ncbi:MAG: 2,3-bisphosphoglycerate-independent phosphoglycerate mutase [Peptoniphilaceae bacterium]
MNRKVLIAIADGLGDLPISEFNNLTPLQYANTPTLDKLAKDGLCGIMDLVKAGVPVGTDMGHLMIFGYENKDYPGRGPVEAAGIGLDLISGDVAFRCNFATIGEDGEVLDRRAGRIREKTRELAESLSGLVIDNVEVIFKEATEHRAVLILRGDDLSANISDTDPKLPQKGLKYKLSKALDDSMEAKRTAKILNEVLKKFHNILENHEVNLDRKKEGKLPANLILTRGAGQVPNIDKITNKIKFKGACVAAESTVLGIANIAGYETISSQGMTGNLDTDVKLKAKLALEALEKNDIVVVHLKATDLMGHDNNPKGKVKAIEKYDEMLSYIVENRPENVMIALAADHSTPCERKEHSGDPVPILFNGPSIRADKVESYDEIECAYGGLNRISGSDFASLYLDYLWLSKKQGN